MTIEQRKRIAASFPISLSLSLSVCENKGRGDQRLVNIEGLEGPSVDQATTNFPQE